MVIYLIKVRPYKDITKNLESIFYKLILFVVNTMILVLAMIDTGSLPSTFRSIRSVISKREGIATGVITCNMIMIIVSIIFTIIELIKTFGESVLTVLRWLWRICQRGPSSEVVRSVYEPAKDSVSKDAKKNDDAIDDGIALVRIEKIEKKPSRKSNTEVSLQKEIESAPTSWIGTPREIRVFPANWKNYLKFLQFNENSHRNESGSDNSPRLAENSLEIKNDQSRRENILYKSSEE